MSNIKPNQNTQALRCKVNASADSDAPVLPSQRAKPDSHARKPAAKHHQTE
jgi:hypothetical protein